MMKRLSAALLCAALLGLWNPVQAAVSADIQAAAKKEGAIVWYTTMQTQTLNAVVKKFGETHPGIALQPLRLGSSQLPARIITEERGGKYGVDVITGDDFQFAQLAEAGVLERYPIPEAAKFIKGTVDPNGYWVTTFANTTVIAYNPQRLKAANLKPPASMADLGAPQWKGQIGVDSGAYNWYTGMLQVSASQAQDVMRKIAANQPIMVSGHSEAASRLEAGEFDVSPTVYGYLAERDKLAGRSIDFVNPRPLLVTLNPSGIAKNAPHPNAARLFIDWLESAETQTFIQSLGGEQSSRLDVTPNPHIWNRSDPYVIVRPPDSAHYNTIVQQFKSIFGIVS